MTQNKRYGSQNKTNQLVKLSVFVALIIIQSWVPMLGNIPTPVLSITYIHVTVILATLWPLFNKRMSNLDRRISKL